MVPRTTHSMETFTRLPRRLTQLYSDTKTSCDAVVDQDTPEPLSEDDALHRRYREQKDRLVAWGLDWSEDTTGAGVSSNNNNNKNGGDIDESLEAAGLADTVTSVLGTIKDILEEAERMHPPVQQHHQTHASRTSSSSGGGIKLAPGSSSESVIKSGGEKTPLASSTASPHPRPSDYASWAASYQSRYENLAQQLTESIDVLYDLSRSRRETSGNTAISTKDFNLDFKQSIKGSGPGPGARVGLGVYVQGQDRQASAKPKSSVHSLPEPLRRVSAAPYLSSAYSASDLTLINPSTQPVLSTAPTTHFKTPNVPAKLDPLDLILPQEDPPPYESVGFSSAIRVIGKLRSRHSSTNPWKTDGSKDIETPVLVEYAAFDPAYRLTQVTPSLDRLDSLLSILTKLANEQTPQNIHGTLRCLGYFEDPRHPRFGIVYELPSSVYSGASDTNKPVQELQPVTLLNVLQTGSKSTHNSNSATPPLEDRFRLAYTLARTFSTIHGSHFVHKDVNSSNILVFRKNRRQSANTKALQYDLRSAAISSFDLFSEFDIEPSNTMPSVNIYRHPEDPKFTGEKGKEHGPQFDLYSLGLVLLEVGLWVPLSDLWKTKYTLSDFKQRVEDIYIRRLASKCGTAYMQAVRDCFWAADRIASNDQNMENFPELYSRILIRLQRCCLLDEVEPSSDWGEQLSHGVAHSFGSSPLKRKSVNPVQAAELPQSPTSHRSAKRWALEKGTQYLERGKSFSKQLTESTTSPKGSPNPSTSLSRHGSQRSQRSQHSIRKSFSQGIASLRSPVEEGAQSMDWESHPSQEPTDSLDGSGTLVASKPITPTFPNDRGDVSSIRKEQLMQAASVIQRAWRASQSSERRQRSTSLKDYKEKVAVIQKAWRQKKERTNSVHTLINLANTQALSYATTNPTRSYPTPEPESQLAGKMTREIEGQTSHITIETNVQPQQKPKLRLHPGQFSPAIVDEWHTKMLPRLERLIERALKKSDETVSIDLLAIGETAEKARPTIFVTCSSVQKVKAILDNRFRYDQDIYDLRVRRGKVRRSKMNRSSRRRKPPHRSMINTDNYADVQVMNPYHQQRPVCGASIGAFRGEHLPPVSYGGVILVDDEPLGMSVHHLLDAPSDDESDYDGEDDISPSPNDAILSSARSGPNPWLMGMGSQPGVQVTSSSPEALWDFEISDDDEDFSKSDNEDQESFHLSSDDDYDSDEEGESEDDDLDSSITSTATIGDIDGIPLGEGEEIKITQPAIDDVEPDFFPAEEDRDDDHLASHELGHVHASSGIRRWKRDGIVHEIDWALLKLNDNRLQPYNLVQGGRRFCINPSMNQEQLDISTRLAQPIQRSKYTQDEDEYPNGVANANNLGGLTVHCFGRTTGLSGGMVGYTMSSVRIYRRKTFSRSWHVTGDFGVGGDSGAWVIQNNTHRVIGHVLAWCERNRIAYICPMQVLLEDIKRTLGAKRIYLPGSVEQKAWVGVGMGMQMQSQHVQHRGTVLQDRKMEDLGIAVEGLGIVDEGVVVDGSSEGQRSREGSPPRGVSGAKRSRLEELGLLGPSGESDKENFGGLMRKGLGVGVGGKQVEVVGVP
ncbi:hypothetical protein B0J11DRAFT_572774 [Dendryphion nanum]|uniref:Protein kinase domain-containing protein n=1 Tax=Dendryphion nanum TaxID=256645 RepID=A0A9P9D5V1_9PLEO|nr:hypothetical protein B0J11DRAFT_572774 [Dendryphion nanum]